MTDPFLLKFNRRITLRITLLATLIPAGAFSARAQTATSDGHRFSHTASFALETSVSTMGPGASLVYRFHPGWAFRAGYEYIRFTWPFSFKENDIHYDADLKYKSGSVSLHATRHLTRSLFISGGCAYNLFQPRVEGTASRDWKYGDIVIPAGDIGEFSILSSPSLRFSPYLGAGIGNRTGSGKRVSFQFEVGTYYQGPPELELYATGLLSPTADPSHGQKETLEKQFRNFYLYPVIKMAVSFVVKKM